MWVPAYDAGGQVRPGAWVAEDTGLLDLAGWPNGMRVVVRKERAHPAHSCGSPTLAAIASPASPQTPKRPYLGAPVPRWSPAPCGLADDQAD